MSKLERVDVSSAILPGDLLVYEDVSKHRAWDPGQRVEIVVYVSDGDIIRLDGGMDLRRRGLLHEANVYRVCS